MNFFHKNIGFLIEKQGFTKIEFFLKIGFEPKGSEEDQLNLLALSSEYFQIPVERLLKEDIEQREKLCKALKIRFLVMDIDGVLTDGGMYYLTSGEEMKKFNTKDGMGIIMLCEKGIKTAFLSSGFRDEIVSLRAKSLQIDKYYVGRESKLSILKKWWQEMNISPSETAYIGDDINDLEVMKSVGLSACPADSIEIVKQNVKIILSKNGGEGCVRELIDNYLLFDFNEKNE